MKRTRHRLSLMALCLFLAFTLLLLVQPVPQAVLAGQEGGSDLVASTLTQVDALQAERDPQDLSRARVEWSTAAPTTGSVLYGVAEDQLDLIAPNTLEPDTVATIHSIALTDLNPDLEYFFVLVIDDQHYDDGGTPFRLPAVIEPIDLASTDVADLPAADAQPADGAVAPELEAIAAETIPSPDTLLDMQATPDVQGAGSFLVKWRTATEGIGWIEYGSSPDTLDQIAYDVRGESELDSVQWVVLPTLPSGMTHYVIIVDGKRYDDGGKPFTLSVPERVFLPAIFGGLSSTNSANNSVSSNDIESEIFAATLSSVAYSFDFPLGARNWWVGYDIKNPSLTGTSGCYNQPMSNIWHAGEDWGVAANTQVKAVADGTVVFADPNYSYPGHVVIIKHTLPDGSIVYSMYGHLGSMYVSTASTNNTVVKGQSIGTVLNQGSNSHLHWEMRTFEDGSTICSRSGKPGPGYTYPDRPGTKGYLNPSEYVRSRSGSSTCLAQSPHPYTDNYNYTWTLTNPDVNATQTRVRFSRIETERNYDYVYVRDANNNQVSRFDGSYPTGALSATVPGRTVRVQLTTDYSVTGWGFCVDRIETVSSGQPPVAPSNLRAIPVDANRIQVNWQDNSTNETGFWVYDGSTPITRLGANTVSYTVTGLAPNSYRCYTVYAYNGIGISTFAGWACTRTPPASVTCTNQYRAEYYNNRTLSGTPVLVRCENWPINYNWGTGGPGGGVPNDNFSVRWTGSASFASGTYTFIARSDDGVRVYLDNTLIINQWVNRGATENRVTRAVSAGTHTIKVEYYDAGGDAVAQFRWEQVQTTPPAEVIVDERSTQFTKSGRYWWDDWSIGYNGHMLWTYVNGTVVSSWGQWRPNLPSTGNYEVFAYIPSRNAFTNSAPYTIYYNGGMRQVRLNQQNYNDVWVSLGTYSFNSGTAGYVRLTDATGEAASSLRRIGFDAVRWTRR